MSDNKKFPEFNVCGLPLKYFVPFFVIVMIATYGGFMPMAKITKDLKPTSYIMTVAYLMAVGGVFFWVGDKTPILGNFFGGACFVPLIGGSLLNYLGLIPKPLVLGTTVLMRGGFQDAYIALLLVGSILVMDRKILLNATARYIPTVLGSQLFAILFAVGAGIVTGFGGVEGLFDIAAPCMSGGSAGAITTLPKLYSDLSGQDMMGQAGKYLCYASISNVLAIVMAGVMNGVTRKIKGLNGEGQILRKGVQEDLSAAKRPGTSDDYRALGGGVFISFLLYIIGNIFGNLPYLSLIPGLAWTIIFGIIVKCSAILPEKYEDYSVYAMNFSLRAMLPMLIAGIGINSLKFNTIAEFFTPGAFIVILITVIGAFLGACLFGHISGLFGYEAGVTAGLCCCNIGGSGDIAVLSAAKRMNLLAFASISTRIGGALMVIWIGLLYHIFH